MANCIPTMVVSENGQEKVYTGNFVPQNASFFDIINSLSYKNENVIRGWVGKKLGPIKVTSLIDLLYIVGNKTLFLLVREFNRSSSRAYNPVALNIKVLAERINSLGEPTILHLNSDIIVNGSSIPSINIFENGNDLLVIKSNNIVDIYNIMLEYFYRKTIELDKTKLATLGKRVQLLLNLVKDEDIKINLTIGNLIHSILHDATLGKILDKLPGNGFDTAREEIFNLMEELTSDINKSKLTIKKSKSEKIDRSKDYEVKLTINGTTETVNGNGYNILNKIVARLLLAYDHLHTGAVVDDEKRESLRVQAINLVPKIINGNEKAEQYINEFINLC